MNVVVAVVVAAVAAALLLICFPVRLPTGGLSDVVRKEVRYTRLSHNFSIKRYEMFVRRFDVKLPDIFLEG